MSRSDAYLRVTCDSCQEQEEEIQLTATAGHNAWDERYVESALRRLGWRTFPGHDQCPDCAEEADADQRED